MAGESKSELISDSQLIPLATALIRESSVNVLSDSTRKERDRLLLASLTGLAYALYGAPAKIFDFDAHNVPTGVLAFALILIAAYFFTNFCLGAYLDFCRLRAQIVELTQPFQILAEPLRLRSDQLAQEVYENFSRSNELFKKGSARWTAQLRARNKLNRDAAQARTEHREFDYDAAFKKYEDELDPDPLIDLSPLSLQTKELSKEHGAIVDAIEMAYRVPNRVLKLLKIQQYTLIGFPIMFSISAVAFIAWRVF